MFIPFVSSLFAACGTQSLAVGYVEGEFVRACPRSRWRRCADCGKARRSCRGRRANRHRGRYGCQDCRGAGRSGTRLQAQSAACFNLQVGKRPEEIAAAGSCCSSPHGRRPMMRNAHYCARAILPGVEWRRRHSSAMPRRSLKWPKPPLARATANLAVGQIASQARRDKRRRKTAVKSAEAQLRKQQNGNARKERSRHPLAGRITDVVRNPGDIAGPSAPVLTMLPDGAAKLKVYIPEERFSDVAASVRFCRCIATVAHLVFRRG